MVLKIIKNIFLIKLFLRSGIFEIGRYGPMNGNSYHYFNGILDFPSVWNRALTQSEIQQFMSSPPTGNEAGLVGYWNFNEGSGNAVSDLSGNGNNGTINGATWSTDTSAQYANNCTATDDIVVTVNPLPTIDLGADTTLICAGTSETLDTGTGLDATYGVMVLPTKLYRPPQVEPILLVEPMPMDVMLVIVW